MTVKRTQSLNKCFLSLFEKLRGELCAITPPHTTYLLGLESWCKTYVDMFNLNYFVGLTSFAQCPLPHLPRSHYNLIGWRVILVFSFCFCFFRTSNSFVCNCQFSTSCYWAIEISLWISSLTLSVLFLRFTFCSWFWFCVCVCVCVCTAAVVMFQTHVYR